LEEDVIATLDVDETGRRHERQKLRDRYGVVAAFQHAGLARTGARFGREIQAEVVLIAVPFPHLHGEQTAALPALPYLPCSLCARFEQLDGISRGVVHQYLFSAGAGNDAAA
jgi:hypothetical protein